MKKELIPILNPVDKDKLFFEISKDWKPAFASFHHKFHLNRLEGYIEHLKFPLSPHRQTVFDFIFLTNGQSKRSKGLDNYNIKKNSFFFLPPYQITAHDFMSQDAEGFYCSFDQEILNKYHCFLNSNKEFPFLEFISNPVVAIPEENISVVVNILERLEKAYNHENTDFDIISIYLLALLHEVKGYAKKEKIIINAALRITQEYKNALVQHIYEKQTVSAYADMLAVSPNHLNKAVKTITGQSAQDILSDMVLLEAKALLRQTDLDIANIAFKIGKENPGDFTRFFKNKTSLTPKQYRQMD